MTDLPFDSYPDRGRCLLGRRKGANCRHEYGLTFARITGATTCSYCGLDMRSSYHAWLTLALDHVVPVSVGRDLGVPVEWTDDYANSVLACAACNGFDNRYRPKFKLEPPSSLDEFWSLRDLIFRDRLERIRKSHEAERRFYEQNWRDAELPHPSMTPTKRKLSLR